MKKNARIIIMVFVAVVAVAMLIVAVLTSPGLMSFITERDGTLKTVIEPESDEEKLNINVIDVPELMTLPDMTREIAINIVEYRETYRRFKSLDDLLNVEGVTPELLESWRPRICCA